MCRCHPLNRRHRGHHKADRNCTRDTASHRLRALDGAMRSTSGRARTTRRRRLRLGSSNALRSDSVPLKRKSRTAPRQFAELLATGSRVKTSYGITREDGHSAVCHGPCSVFRFNPRQQAGLLDRRAAHQTRRHQRLNDGPHRLRGAISRVLRTLSLGKTQSITST